MKLLLRRPRILNQCLGIILGSMLITMSCETPPPSVEKENIQIAQLSKGEGPDFTSIRETFVQKNPGYDLSYKKDIKSISPEDFSRILFVQEGSSPIQLSSGESSQVYMGDIVILDANVDLNADSLLSILVFQVPENPADSIPRIIRPDWDPNITDVPGGCATETNAYRRVLLTWQGKVGKYLYHALNTHRVRIMDSFSHYHPQVGGFDEFYLVQMALPEAKLLTSNKVNLITQPETVEKTQAENLIESTDLNVGDLIYIPRGIMHRGIGGVLAHVITVPGFIPGSEIGVDHHLRAINERLGLPKELQLPYHEEGSHAPIIK